VVGVSVCLFGPRCVERREVYRKAKRRESVVVVECRSFEYTLYDS
jgi:hypothetical protein